MGTGVSVTWRNETWIYGKMMHSVHRCVPDSGLVFQILGRPLGKRVFNSWISFAMLHFWTSVCATQRGLSPLCHGLLLFDNNPALFFDKVSLFENNQPEISDTPYKGKFLLFEIQGRHYGWRCGIPEIRGMPYPVSLSSMRINADHIENDFFYEKL